jgi:hypothetical protein
MGVLLFLLEPVMYADHVLFSNIRRAEQFIRIRNYPLVDDFEVSLTLSPSPPFTGS